MRKPSSVLKSSFPSRVIDAAINDVATGPRHGGEIAVGPFIVGPDLDRIVGIGKIERLDDIRPCADKEHHRLPIDIDDNWLAFVTAQGACRLRPGQLQIADVILVEIFEIAVTLEPEIPPMPGQRSGFLLFWTISSSEPALAPTAESEAIAKMAHAAWHNKLFRQLMYVPPGPDHEIVGIASLLTPDGVSAASRSCCRGNISKCVLGDRYGIPEMAGETSRSVVWFHSSTSC